MGLYSRLKAKGATDADAAFRARDLLDFSMYGRAAGVQYLTNMLPFLNARMQGLAKLGSAVRENPMNTFFKTGLLLGATTLLWAANKDDDRWKELEDWDKRTYWHVWTPDGNHWRIPKPFEAGIAPTAMETVLDIMAGDEDWGHAWTQIIATLGETFAMNPIPQAAKPAIENYTNKSFFTGRPVEGLAVSGLLPGHRSTPMTSDTMKLIGEKTGFSPVKMENLVRGYFSTVGMLALFGADSIVRQAYDFPVKPAWDVRDYPLIGRFFRGKVEKNSKYNTRFYELITEINQTHQTIQHLRRSGDYKQAMELQAEGWGKLRHRERFNQVRRELSEINKKIRQAYNNRTMKDSEKKRIYIEKLTIKKNALISGLYKAYARNR
jgi:hypothetical protein